MPEPTFEQLSEQVQLLTQRVAALEREFGLRPVPAESQAQVTSASVLPVAPVVLSPAESKGRPDPITARDLESSLGLRLVNRVGAVTFILGIAFFFRYAVENNWIGETARVFLGALAGLLLLAGGELAFRRGQQVFAQGITGTGGAALYLSIYAAFGPYHLIPLAAAITLLGAATVLEAHLALRYGSQAIAILALFGGLLAPLALEEHRLGEWFVPLYVALLDAGFLYLASRRGWHVIEGLALGGTALLTINLSEVPLRVFLSVYYLLFTTRPNRALFLAAHVLLLGRATFLPAKMWDYPPELVALSLAGLAVVQWRGWFRFTTFLVAAAGASWLLADSFGKFPLADALVTLTLLFVIFFSFLIWRTMSAAAPARPGEVAAIPLNAALYFGACYVRLAGSRDEWAAFLAIILAALHFALAFRTRQLPAPNLPGMISAAVSVVFLTLAIPIQFRAFRITAAWALEGAALVWVAGKRGISTLQVLGLLVLLFAAARFVGLDLGMYATPADHATLWNARFVTAAVLATAFFLAALRSSRAAIPAWTPGLAGHLVLLTGLAYEVADWAQRNHFANRNNAESAALSVLFAAYSVVLVGIGTRWRSVASRYMGLALIALVIVKLYLYDVWQLDLVYRFVAFAALGALLLTMSFLYSRYRVAVASWLKTNEVTPHAASATHPLRPPE